MTVVVKLLLAIFSLISISAISYATELDWKKAARNVEAKKIRLEEIADEKGWDDFLGSMYNEFMVQEHQCAILGRMLNKTSLIKQLEPAEPSKNEEAREFALAAHSLDNWLAILESLLSQNHAARVKIWNLDCVGKLGIPINARIAEIDMVNTFYTIENDGMVLRILGDVEKGFYKQLVSALDSNPSVKTVVLGSAGGFVTEALQAGLEIRKRGIATTLWNNCYSACPLVFIGGIERTIWSPYAELGFHQISNSVGAVPQNSQIYDLVSDYSDEMGVNKNILLGWMVSAKPDEIHVADYQELCASKIATWVQRLCSQDD